VKYEAAKVVRALKRVAEMLKKREARVDPTRGLMRVRPASRSNHR
jgi:hypothetical protein